MGRVKQENIDIDVSEIVTEDIDVIRVYHIDDRFVTRELYIMELSLALYDHTPNENFREVIGSLITGDYEEMLTIGGRNFFSYIQDPLENDRSDIINQVFELKKTGLSNKEIATKLGIRESTVYMSPYTIGVDLGVEERPLKHYLVTYDVEVKPLLHFGRKKRLWKRTSEVCLGDSFKDAKTQVRKRCHEEGKSTKNFEVVIQKEKFSGYTVGDLNE